jgi:hypothetical protein
MLRPGASVAWLYTLCGAVFLVPDSLLILFRIRSEFYWHVNCLLG